MPSDPPVMPAPGFSVLVGAMAMVQGLSTSAVIPLRAIPPTVIDALTAWLVVSTSCFLFIGGALLVARRRLALPVMIVSSAAMLLQQSWLLRRDLLHLGDFLPAAGLDMLLPAFFLIAVSLPELRATLKKRIP